MNDPIQTLFTPGTSLTDTPVGDEQRQAVDSLRGYAYQIAASALAWVDLGDGSRLYLEVAEDYATVASQALSAVQVKDTAGSGSVTLNTASVREAVDSFVRLTAGNPGRAVELRYLTTSPSGTEHVRDDRRTGDPGLVYWRKAAGGADVGPLRAILKKHTFSQAVRDFVDARDDDALRRDLLRNVHWDCGRPELSGIVGELEERLIVLGRDRFHLPTIEARRLVSTVMYYVLKKSILPKTQERVLTRAELYSVVDAATLVAMPRGASTAMAQLASAMAGVLAGGSPQTAFHAHEISWLIASDDLPPPRSVIARPEFEALIGDVLTNYGVTILVAGSGLGKSLVARATALRARLENG